jgi:quinol-cytochrome oxidoreductase complex cytochrome b subunit
VFESIFETPKNYWYYAGVCLAAILAILLFGGLFLFVIYKCKKDSNNTKDHVEIEKC